MAGAECRNARGVLQCEINHIRDMVEVFDKETNDPACTEGDYYIDAAIAILEIGISSIERTERLARPEHLRLEEPCPCQVAMHSPALDDFSNSQSTCPVRASFWDIARSFRVVSPFNHIRRDPYSESNESEDDGNVTQY